MILNLKISLKLASCQWIFPKENPSEFVKKLHKLPISITAFADFECTNNLLNKTKASTKKINKQKPISWAFAVL